jgi:hypothetical protein
MQLEFISRQDYAVKTSPHFLPCVIPAHISSRREEAALSASRAAKISFE